VTSAPELINGNDELILLVDDEANIRCVTKMILEKHHYRVIEASDAPEALAIFAQQMSSIGAVITDIMMPYMDGVALVRALKKMKEDLVFVASTGQGDEPRLPELHELGVRNFLPKPYDTGQLLKTLHDALAGTPVGPSRPPTEPDPTSFPALAPNDARSI
jgi:DNA-binding NtrC family response regulator